MKTAAAFLIILLVCPIGHAADAAPVLAQDLDQLIVTGKVSNVLWTRRVDSCTVQVLLPRNVPSRRASRVRQRPSYPRIAVWLLRSDGSRIEPTGRWQSPLEPPDCVRCLGAEVQYSFPLSAAGEASAVAIGVDDEYRTQRLRTFEAATR